MIIIATQPLQPNYPRNIPHSIPRRKKKQKILRFPPFLSCQFTLSSSYHPQKSNPFLPRAFQSKMDTTRKRKPLPKWLCPSLVLFIFLLLLSTSIFPRLFLFLRGRTRLADISPADFVESRLTLSGPSSDPVPRLAYLISGSAGDGESLKRTLRAIYHPRNQYVLHLDLEASALERLDLAGFVEGHPFFSKVGNVRMNVRANLVTYRGPTMVSNTLHAAAILLREGGDWDWFINLSASDYPLVTQDDLLHTLSAVPRTYNFIEHTSDIGWKEFQRAKPVLIDPGLYSLHKSDVFSVPEARRVPSAYRLFTGSAWMMLSRPFIEYCLWGWDNLPRIILMYYSNFLSSAEGYFHTVICNADEFRNTTVNHDLHFISWDNPPTQHPHYLTLKDFQRMVDSNAPFARKFTRNEPVLDRIDSELLNRSVDGFARGGWLDAGDDMGGSFADRVSPNVTVLRPSLGVKRLGKLISGLLQTKKFSANQCV